ncbi:MAG: hypothetical protein PHF37_04170 [Phycisphaerae bacterium]|nr:hypothetical protein [Phycisphaerae bacterium]
MAKKKLWAKFIGWFGATPAKPDSGVSDEGLIGSIDEPNSANSVTVKPHSRDRVESIEKLQAGFDKLIDQLANINEHLHQQATQHENLVSKMDKLPNLFENFPLIAENQKRITEQMIEQLKQSAAKNEQFVQAVQKIPTETSKQTQSLSGIDQRLGETSKVNAKMSENFDNFNQTLDKLNRNTANQTDGILQMSKTFATSDRYLKFLMARQNRRMMWMFITTVGVCLFAIVVLVLIIIFLKN